MMTNVQEESGDHARLILLKGKRTKRQRSSSPLTNANANANANAVLEYEVTTDEDEDMANCLMLLSQGNTKITNSVNYHCKTCDKSFLSFQALGGHRASHKKLKSASASAVETLENGGFLSLQVTSGELYCNKKQEKTHECSICKAEFSSGQALGGHMRRHRGLILNSNNNNNNININQESCKRSKNFLELDLNLPAPEDEKTRFTFGAKDQILVFNSLIDCHH